MNGSSWLNLALFRVQVYGLNLGENRSTVEVGAGLVLVCLREQRNEGNSSRMMRRVLDPRSDVWSWSGSRPPRPRGSRPRGLYPHSLTPRRRPQPCPRVETSVSPKKRETVRSSLTVSSKRGDHRVLPGLCIESSSRSYIASRSVISSLCRTPSLDGLCCRIGDMSRNVDGMLEDGLFTRSNIYKSITHGWFYSYQESYLLFFFLIHVNREIQTINL